MFETKWLDIDLKFETNDKVFSPQGIDRGTMAMLSKVIFTQEDKVLDLGCGYGVVGIIAAKQIGADKVLLCDISEDAIQLALENAKTNEVADIRIVKSNGLKDIEETDFTMILSNPPYHVDFQVPKEFIENGYKKLVFGGKLFMVTKRKDWYKNKLIAVFGGVHIDEMDGYYIFTAEKRSGSTGKKKKEIKTNHLSKKLAKKENMKNSRKSL